jgi:hypothetical protein
VIATAWPFAWDREAEHLTLDHVLLHVHEHQSVLPHQVEPASTRESSIRASDLFVVVAVRPVWAVFARGAFAAHVLEVAAGAALDAAPEQMVGPERHAAIAAGREPVVTVRVKHAGVDMSLAGRRATEMAWGREPRTAVVVSLVAEWAVLCRRHRRSTVVARWGQLQPALATAARLCDVIPSAGVDRRPFCQTLAALAAGRDGLAARALFQLSVLASCAWPPGGAGSSRA